MNCITVYIVEDDPMVISINKEYTERISPFRVIGYSSNQQEAIQSIKGLKPDLVLLDIYLQRGNGLQLLKQIRQQKLPVDIILVTAAKDSDTVFESLRYGVVDYLIKPFDYDRLKQALLRYHKLRLLQKEKVDFTQDDLDHIRVTNSPSALSSLPKGVQSPTLDLILDFLVRQSEALSCQEIASMLNISKITAWRYLEFLVDKGDVEVSLDHGGIGRPTKKYLISPKARITLN